MSQKGGIVLDENKIKYTAIIDKSTFEVLNSEFTKAKAYILYYGENRNGSRMTKEAVENAFPSLYNVPVVAEWVEKKEDFGTHGGKIIISDEGIEFVQTTKPYGLVPESCNPRWEMVDDKEYLVADIILWSGRYAELEKTIEEFSNQSMEINVFEGSFSEADKVYDISKFEFSALCLLGQSVEPCFEKSKVVAYGLDEFKSEMDEMFKNYKTFASENNAESEQEEIEVVHKFELTMKDKLSKLQDALPDERVENGDEWVSSTYYWVMDFDSNYVYFSRDIYVAEGSNEYKHFRAKYQFGEDDVATVDKSTFEEIFNQWLTKTEMDIIEAERNSAMMALKDENTSLQSKVSEFESTIFEKDKTINELQEYKNKNEFEINKFDIENLLEEFEPTLAEIEEYKALKDNINKSFEKNELFMSLDALEKELYAIEGRIKHKSTFTKQKKQNFSRVSIETEVTEKTGVFGTAEKYFPKK
jgi:hypothetical protein